ncbi:hypothetical protein BJ741DRAFT_604097 [Chytriomyces cf. hyalinus JEL632]|nr:hypothetical protein BJ741DRAFT_604097 [Chytriomyces cf. hyalinus JEL632]
MSNSRTSRKRRSQSGDTLENEPNLDLNSISIDLDQLSHSFTANETGHAFQEHAAIRTNITDPQHATDLDGQNTSFQQRSRNRRACTIITQSSVSSNSPAAVSSVSPLSADSHFAAIKVQPDSDERPQKAHKRSGRKYTNEPAPNKRIAQNRIAQRMHRERKQAYIHDMELKVIELTDLVEQLTSELQMQMRGCNNNNIDGVEPDIGVTSQAEDSLVQKIVPSSAAATTHDNNSNGSSNPSNLDLDDEANTIQLLKQTIAELECENESLRHVAFAFDLKPLSSTPHVANVHFMPGSAAWGDHALHFTKPVGSFFPESGAGLNMQQHLLFSPATTVWSEVGSAES